MKPPKQEHMQMESIQRVYRPREEVTSPTKMMESILITGVVDAKQKRDIMTLDVAT